MPCSVHPIYITVSLPTETLWWLRQGSVHESEFHKMSLIRSEAVAPTLMPILITKIRASRVGSVSYNSLLFYFSIVTASWQMIVLDFQSFKLGKAYNAHLPLWRQISGYQRRLKECDRHLLGIIQHVVRQLFARRPLTRYKLIWRRPVQWPFQ